MPFGEQEKLTPEEFAALVDRAGLRVAPEEMDRLRAAFDQFRQQLRSLHSADLGARDPAVAFTPVEPS